MGSTLPLGVDALLSGVFAPPPRCASQVSCTNKNNRVLECILASLGPTIITRCVTSRYTSTELCVYGVRLTGSCLCIGAALIVVAVGRGCS